MLLTDMGGTLRDQLDWVAFLRHWNAEALASRLLREELSYTTDDELRMAVACGWLGFPGATEAELAAAEAQLGARLPNSYRTFLTVSNGWLWPSVHIPKLWSTAEIAWLPFRHREGIDSWREGERLYSQDYPVAVPDAEYLLYGAEQSPFTLRSEYLETALDISAQERAGTALYLLNPRVTSDGEWEAWFWAHWLPGAARYRSFAELMFGTYEQFR
jgi:hypothetical protein